MTEPWLRGPRSLLLALAVATGLSLPSVGLGYMLDDFFHVGTLEGRPTPAAPYDLFRFATGRAEDTAPFIFKGPFPWWSYPKVKLTFLRPLSSALAVGEHALFGRAPALAHLHSILWYLALLAALAGTLKRWVGEGLAGATLLLFAIDDVHWMPVSWLANRNALVAAAPMFAALWAHIRWREERWKPGLPFSLLLMAVGFAGGEVALGVLGFFVGYEIALGPGQRKDQLRALVPMALVTLTYVGIYVGFGYGAAWSGVYLDPIHAPRTFLYALPGRVLALAACQLLSFPADLWAFDPDIRPAQVVTGAVALALFSWLGRRMWPALPKQEQRGLLGVTLGSVASLVPVAATFPANRLLLLPSVAGAAWVAALLRHAWKRKSTLDSGIVTGLLLFHVVLAIASWPLFMHVSGDSTRRAVAAFRAAPIPDDGLERRRVVMVNPPDMAVAMYPFQVRALEGHPQPRAWWPLSMERRAMTLVRTSDRRLELTSRGKPFMEGMFEQLTRSPDLPLREGENIPLDGASVTVLETEGPFARRIAFETKVPFEDPSLLFLRWKEGALEQLALPAVGETLELPQEKGLLAPE